MLLHIALSRVKDPLLRVQVMGTRLSCEGTHEPYEMILWRDECKYMQGIGGLANACGSSKIQVSGKYRSRFILMTLEVSCIVIPTLH